MNIIDKEYDKIYSDYMNSSTIGISELKKAKLKAKFNLAKAIINLNETPSGCHKCFFRGRGTGKCLLNGINECNVYDFTKYLLEMI